MHEKKQLVVELALYLHNTLGQPIETFCGYIWDSESVLDQGKKSIGLIPVKNVVSNSWEKNSVSQRGTKVYLINPLIFLSITYKKGKYEQYKIMSKDIENPVDFGGNEADILVLFLALHYDKHLSYITKQYSYISKY